MDLIPSKIKTLEYLKKDFQSNRMEKSGEDDIYLRWILDFYLLNFKMIQQFSEDKELSLTQGYSAAKQLFVELLSKTQTTFYQ